MSEYITGFCSTGACEGTEPRSPSGKELETCVGVYMVTVGLSTFGAQREVVCNHSCHDTSRELREMMASMGKILPIPERRKPKDRERLTLPPRVAVIPAASTTAAATAPSGVPVVIDAAGIARTPSGRAAKGALEEQVRQVLNKSMLFVDMGMVTPGYICRIIDKENPPSQGAVLAVLERWAAKSFIVLGDKPKHIQAVTDLGKRNLRLK